MLLTARGEVAQLEAAHADVLVQMAQLTELRTNLTADAENEEAEEALVAEEARRATSALLPPIISSLVSVQSIN